MCLRLKTRMWDVHTIYNDVSVYKMHAITQFPCSFNKTISMRSKKKGVLSSYTNNIQCTHIHYSVTKVTQSPASCRI